MSEQKPERKRGVKKTKLTPEREAKILSMIGAGNFKSTAAAAAGIHPNTLDLWLREGTDEFDADGNTTKKAREPFRSFAEKFREHEALGEVALVQGVKAGGWKGCLSILQRRFPHWTDRRRIDLGNADGSNLAPAVAPIITIHVDGVPDGSPFFEKAADDEPPEG